MTTSVIQNPELKLIDEFLARSSRPCSHRNMTFKFCPRCAHPLGDFIHNGEPRKGCTVEACGFVHYDNPTPVVAAIVELNAHVILVQNHGWPTDWFGLVTGFLESKEEPEAGVLREVREELGLDADLVGLVGVYGFDAMNQVIIAYHVRAQGHIQLGAELAAYKAVPIHRLKPWPFATGLAVRDWLANRA